MESANDFPEAEWAKKLQSLRGKIPTDYEAKEAVQTTLQFGAGGQVRVVGWQFNHC